MTRMSPVAGTLLAPGDVEGSEHTLLDAVGHQPLPPGGNGDVRAMVPSEFDHRRLSVHWFLPKAKKVAFGEEGTDGQPQGGSAVERRRDPDIRQVQLSHVFLSAPGARSPSLGRASVSVAAARTAGTRATPVAASNPEGISKESTGASWPFAQRIRAAAGPWGEPFRLYPITPSTTRSGRVVSDGGSPTPEGTLIRRKISSCCAGTGVNSPGGLVRKTSMSAPQAESRLAQTRAPPPLPPVPARMTTFLPLGSPPRNRARARCARARPAFSIIRTRSIPKSSVIARSTSIICRTVR